MEHRRADAFGLVETADRLHQGIDMVVRTVLSRRAPDGSGLRVARSTAPQAASGRRRRVSAVILRRPCSPSGVRRRRPLPSGVVMFAQTVSRTVSVTVASVTVLVAAGRLRQAREVLAAICTPWGLSSCLCKWCAWGYRYGVIRSG
jgi:hypothetical protein